MNTSDDTPIEKPENDLFGVDRFSKSIATTFLQQKSPEGTVIAINGPWGGREKQRRQRKSRSLISNAGGFRERKPSYWHSFKHFMRG